MTIISISEYITSGILSIWIPVVIIVVVIAITRRHGRIVFRNWRIELNIPDDKKEEEKDIELPGKRKGRQGRQSDKI